MNTPTLLTEELKPGECNLIQESSTDGKTIWLSGVCMQSSITNRNGRKYPLSEITSAVKSAMDRVKESNGIFGELDHPQSLQINLDRVSHVITEMWMTGNDAYGKAKLLNTPMGQIAQELVRSGVKVGVSSRGAGNVTESGEVSGFNYITYDLVATPSAPGAFPGTVYESLHGTNKGKRVMTLSEQVKHDPAAQKYFKKEFTAWLETMQFVKK